MIACDVKIQPEKKAVCCEVFVNLQRTYKEVHELKS